MNGSFTNGSILICLQTQGDGRPPGHGKACQTRQLGWVKD
jgi:hypothetical protein